MTAGRGVVHGEMFPLVRSDTGNRLKLFQIWLNLPARNKMVEPHFVMHWAEQIPKVYRARGCGRAGERVRQRVSRRARERA